MQATLIEKYSPSADTIHEVPSLNVRQPLRVLRLSVTEHCNYRCRYCMPDNGMPKHEQAAILPLHELGTLVGWLSVHAGISSVKLTGGEPLVRKGITSFVAQLSTIPAISEISLTTNGSLLASMAGSLKAAGLNRVNISLDTVNKERFATVTRGGKLQDTLNGIDSARDAGLTPIKLNTVLQRSTWKEEVPRLLDYAVAIGAEIRFIELMRMGTEREWCNSEFVSADEVCSSLRVEMYQEDAQSSSPARISQLNWYGSDVNVGWITPRSHPFCRRCERLRMDSRGLVRRCLMDLSTLNLANIINTNNGLSVCQAFARYMAGKTRPLAMDSPFAMSQIGG